MTFLQRAVRLKLAIMAILLVSSSAMFALTAPNRISPMDEDSCIVDEVALIWNEVADADSYNVQVAEEDNFNANKIVDIEDYTDTTYTVTGLQIEEDYYWRIAALDDQGSIIWTTSWQFKTIKEGPNLQAPLDGAFWLDTDVDLAWSAYTGATKYEIEIYDDDDLQIGDRIYHNDNVQQNLTTLNVIVPENNTNYWWRMRAEINNDCWTEWSEVWQFRTKADRVVTTNPSDDETCLPISVNFQWQAQDQAWYYQMEVSIDESFGDQFIVFSADSLTTNSRTVTLPNYVDQYWWRVRSGFRGDNETPWTLKQSFSTKQIGPQPLEPANDMTLDGFNVTMTWNNSTPADSFKLVFDNNANFNTPTIIYTEDTSYTTALPNTFNQTYYWKVSSFYESAWDNCESEESAVWSFKTSYPAPTLRSPLDTRTCLPLTYEYEWNEIQGVISYRLQIAVDANFNNIVVDKNNIQDLKYEATIEDGLRKYWWRVRAEDDDNTGVWSTVRTFTSQPEKPRLFDPSDGSVAVPLDVYFEWREITADAVYGIQIADNPDFNPVEIEVDDIEDPDYTTTLSKYNTQYYWRVKVSVNGCDQGYSQAWSFRTRIGKPTLTFPPDEATEQPWGIVFRWLVLSGADTYEIQLSKDMNFNNIFFATAGIPNNAYYITNLESEETYYWRVRARDANGPGAWSDPFVFTTIEQGAGIPVLVSPIYAATKVPVDVTLEWLPALRAQRYRLQLSTDERFRSQDLLLDRNDITETEYDLTDLDNYTTYWWRVSAINDSGETRFSTPFFFRTIALPPANAPMLIQPADGLEIVGTFTKFQWSQVDRAESYEMEISKDESFATVNVHYPFLYNFEKPYNRLDIESEYWWRVRARNEAGLSDWSEVWNLTTLNPLSVEELVEKYELNAYPNPFDATTTISFHVPQAGNVKIDLIDIKGTKVATIANEFMFAGSQNVKLSADGLLSGYYWYVITIDGEQVAQPLIIRK